MTTDLMLRETQMLDQHIDAALESDQVVLAAGKLARAIAHTEAVRVETDADHAAAIEAIRNLAHEARAVKTLIDTWRSPIHAAWKRLTSASADLLGPATQAEAALRDRVQAWRDAREAERTRAIEEERQRREAEVREARERQQAAAREEEAARWRERDATSKAEREAAARDADAREADRQAAARETAAVEHAPPTPPAKDAYLPPQKGVAGRKTWKAGVADLTALILAVADDLTHDRQSPLLAAVTVDKRKLGQIARAHEGTLDYPGVRFWLEGGVNIRRDPPRS